MVSAVAEKLDLSRQTVYGWIDRLQGRAGQGLEARLADAPRYGRARTAAGIIDTLTDSVLETDPRELGCRSTIWAAPVLATYLMEQHQLTVYCEVFVDKSEAQ